MCWHRERHEAKGTFVIREIPKKRRRKDGYSHGIAIVFSETDFPDAFLLNIQTKQVITFKYLERAKERLETLPTTISFCPTCGDVENQSFPQEKGGSFRFTIRGLLTKPITV